MHPIASVLNHGIPVCLCSDDPSAFGNLGLSFDFYQVLVSSEQTGLITLGEIALDSLRVGDPDDTRPGLSLTLLSIRRLKRRKRNARSRCGRRGGRSFWRKLSKLGEICRLPLFRVENPGCVYETNGAPVLPGARSVPTLRTLVSPSDSQVNVNIAPHESGPKRTGRRFLRAGASRLPREARSCRFWTMPVNIAREP